MFFNECDRFYVGLVRAVAVVLFVGVFLTPLHGSIDRRFIELKRFDFYLGQNIQRDLSEVISLAEDSIDIGMFFAFSPGGGMQELYDEIVEAEQRGVEVRIGLDKKDQEFTKYMREHGAEVKYYSEERIHHLKAVVIDEQYVFIGSQNFSTPGMQGDNWEAGAIVRSEQLGTEVSNYLNSFW